ncbi:MAG: mechanosensitive ion channel family protein [Actinomycetales bacterium]|nr:mechanosensitive ion channel family protein [Actinomycetales bacterium]
MDKFVHWFIGKPLSVAITVLIAIVIRAVLVRVTDRLIRRATALHASRGISKLTKQDYEAVQNRKDQRADSIGQLLRSMITIFVWSIAVITALSTLGINVAPILTSAGVVGVAVGFGAQTLVKDYLAGIIMIIEDQYGVGDVVDVGPVTGTVVEIGLRVTRLQDADGVIWYMRNGEVARIANHSQSA